RGTLEHANRDGSGRGDWYKRELAARALLTPLHGTPRRLARLPLGRGGGPVLVRAPRRRVRLPRGDPAGRLRRHAIAGEEVLRLRCGPVRPQPATAARPRRIDPRRGALLAR